MTEQSRRLLHQLRSKRGGDDLLRELLRAQSSNADSRTATLGDGLTVRVRPLGKGTGSPSTGEADR